jgi:hypothetical protein
MVLGSVGGLALVCCLACLRRVQVKCRAPKEGFTTLYNPDGTQIKANWIIRQMTEDESQARRTSSEGLGSTGVSSAGSMGSVGTQGSRRKKHVVWEFSADALQSYGLGNFQREAGDEAGGSPEGELGVDASPSFQGPPVPSPPRAAADADLDDDPPDALAILASTDEGINSRVTPLDEEAEAEREREIINSLTYFPDGADIEYYSTSNGNWLPGSVVLSLKNKYGNPKLQYDIIFPRSNKNREDVPVDCLRKRFAQAELVEVYSKRNEGEWLPACINGQPAAWAVTLGYRVQVEEAGIVLENVQPWRLRRRFPAGCGVDVFREGRGWDRAVVHSLADSAQAAGHPMALKPVPKLSSTSPCGPHDMEANNHVPTWAPWTYIPVFEEAAGEEGNTSVEADEPEWIPSYNVRRPLQNDLDAASIKI